MPLQDFLPDYDVRELDEVFVAAPPAVAYVAARRFDLARIWWIRALFAARELPMRTFRRAAGDGARDGESEALGIEAITRQGTGFLLLEDRPPEEIVVGSIGKFWRPRIEFAAVPPERFAAFMEPGYGKLVWGYRIEPSGGGSRVALELRVTATDERSRRRFHRYWRVIGPFSHAIRRSALAVVARDFEPGSGRTSPPAAP